MCTEVPPAAPAPLTRRTALLASAGLAASTVLTVAGAPSASATPQGGGRPGRRGRLDLSYVLGEDFPAYTPGEEAQRRPGNTIARDGYYQQRWDLYEHTGTHLDAPAHFNPNGRPVTALTTDELMVPAVVVDIAARATQDPDTVVTVADLRAHEQRYGRIEERAAVLMHSGWAAKVADPDAYRGTDSAGVLHFPGFGDDACEWLLKKRRIVALGVDTLSIDPGNSTAFPTHLRLNGAERYGIENLANLRRLPPRGARIVVGVVPFKAGSGGPARVLAEW